MLGEGRCRSSSSVPVTPHGAGTKPPPPRPFPPLLPFTTRQMQTSCFVRCESHRVPRRSAACRHTPSQTPSLFVFKNTASDRKTSSYRHGRQSKPSSAPHPDKRRALTKPAAAQHRAVPARRTPRPPAAPHLCCSGSRPSAELRLSSRRHRPGKLLWAAALQRSPASVESVPWNRGIPGSRRGPQERGARLRTGRPKIQTPRRGALPGGSLSAGGSGPRPPPGEEPHPQRPTGISRSSSSTVSSGSVAVTGEQSSALPLGALWGAAFPPWGGCTRPPRERMHAASWGCTWPPRGVARGRATWSCSCRARQGRAASPRSFLEQRLSSRDH